MRVLITDPLSDVSLALLKEAGLQPDVQIGRSPEELVSIVPGAAAWLIRSGTRVTADLIEAADELKVIGRAGVGVDNVDLDAATRRGVLVINAPDGNTISTAEHTCAMILSLARKIPAAHESLRRGEWARTRFDGSELAGKTLGVIGVGKIGRVVAMRMAGFDMRLVGFDPVLGAEAAERIGITLVELDEVFERADVITVHTPLNTATRNLIDADALSKCKRGVWIVNCARGGIVDERALLVGLQDGHVGGAALDVFSQEPPGADLRSLVEHPGVVVTPHIAASTSEAQEKVATQVVEGVIDALAGRPVATPVNAGAIRAAAQPEAKPFIELADRLGQTAAQLARGHIERAAIRCSGETAHRFAEVLTVAAVRGMMAHWSDEPVNLINAPLLAREAGLHLEENRVMEAGDFTNLVEVRLETTDGITEVKGAVLGKNDPRLVELDGFHFEVRLQGHLLFYRNIDRPGMVASVGRILADAGVNIAALALSRTGPGGVAQSAFSVDERPAEDVLEAISRINGVEDVRIAHLD